MNGLVIKLYNGYSEQKAKSLENAKRAVIF